MFKVKKRIVVIRGCCWTSGLIWVLLERRQIARHLTRSYTHTLARHDSDSTTDKNHDTGPSTIRALSLTGCFASHHAFSSNRTIKYCRTNLKSTGNSGCDSKRQRYDVITIISCSLSPFPNSPSFFGHINDLFAFIGTASFRKRPSPGLWGDLLFGVKVHKSVDWDNKWRSEHTWISPSPLWTPRMVLSFGL